jgi:signal transduction histidine kinase
VISFLSRLSDHAAIAVSNAQLYAAVQTANLAKSQFVSSAAHELKNPLTSIKGYSDLLIGGAVGSVSDGQARFLTTIRSNADRMSTLVSDLQDISRIEAGQLRLQFSAVSFVELSNEVVRALRKQIEEKEQSLEIQIADVERLPLVWGDNTRLIQIMTNLLSNAHKYTPQGGRLAIQAELANNQWDHYGSNLVIHVCVADTGIGIGLEDQKKIFQQFFRSENPEVREATGTGLGLSITRRLVELQGGKIWFESELDVGTTFHFTIPVADTGEQEAGN